MVAKVISGKDIRGILNYNENKVKEGTAQCIMAHRFGCDASILSFSDKLSRFRKATVLNTKVKTNALHISLNFDPSETFTIERLNAIATTYMNKIGFGEQPYLVYKHTDAAHPHIHIMTTNIQHDGKRIDIHNIGKNQSEKARIQIEKEFKLVKAVSKNSNKESINPIQVERIMYGKAETKRSIANAVLMVTRSYKYTSLPEFNAVLRQFNVVADRGKEGTQMHNRKGLVYSLIDRGGKKIGVPIKASTLYQKPILSFLENQFAKNETDRVPFKENVRKQIDNCMRDSKPNSLQDLSKALQQENIYVVLRLTKDGKVFGITFVDNKSKVVFNGSNLGKDYSAGSLAKRMAGDKFDQATKESTFKYHDEWIELNLGIGDMLKELTTAEQLDYQSPAAATKRKRKKKRRRSR